MPHAFHIPAQMGELIDEALLTLDDLARACCRAPDWVSERVEAGVIAPTQPGTGVGAWRFSSTTVLRARRIAQLEATFGADPYLAALTTDLMEEVAMLRRRLRHTEESGSTPL
jgi:chaperone modulatory protein CbpM